MRQGRWIAFLLGLALIGALRIAHAEAGAQNEAERARGPANAEQRILVVGDSLTAEYGLPRGSGWLTHIQKKLQGRDQAYQIRNASISGDTTIGGLQRLPALLNDFHPDFVVLQLGANDGLRGLPVSEMRANLRKMIDLSQAAGAKVLLIGQHVPPNYGPRYAREFHAVYGSVAEETGVALVPFMLEGIAADTAMFQADGLHPTAEAQAHIAETIWPQLEALLGH